MTTGEALVRALAFFMGGMGLYFLVRIAIMLGHISVSLKKLANKK